MTAVEQAPAVKAPLWKAALRIAVSVAILALLLLNVPDLDGVIPEQHHLATLLLVGAAVATTFLGVVLSAWRWQRVLKVFEVDVPLRVLTSHYLAGLFVGNVLPSTIGGDVLRVSRCSATTGSPEIAFASVVLERLTGFVALPVLVFTGLLLRPSLLDEDPVWLALLVAGITLGVLAAILYLAGHPRIAGRFKDHDNWMRYIGAVHLGVDRLRRHPRGALEVLGTALVYQVSVITAVAIIFRALDLPAPVAAAIAFVPAVAMMQVLPVTFGGLGVREAMLVLFLRPFGVSGAQAIAAGLLWFTATLVVSMLGAPAFAVGHRHRHRTPASASSAVGSPAP